MFTDFSLSLYHKALQPPIAITDICLFVSYLHQAGKAPKTISTYLSAVGYIHKLQGFQDPTTSFLVSKLIAGAYRIRPSWDLRLPITLEILNKLVDAVQHTVPTIYDIKLYRAMYLFAFSTFARIGELTSNTNSTNVVQLSDIEFLHSPTGTVVNVVFRKFKHNNGGRPHRISFGAGASTVSPTLALSEFLNFRGSQPGSLFCSVSGRPISRHSFDTNLHKTLQFCNFDSARYKGHSFRIGAATYRSKQGDSDLQIRALGRWNSNAFLKYIRTHNQ